MNSAEWMDELNRLLARMAAIGLAPDIDSMNLNEQWGVYCVLRRLLDGSQRGGNE